MSYQTEERYWTDYVRIATPIVGLLLLLGVFWFWASSLIGDSSGNPPPTQPAAAVTLIPAATQTPSPTEEVNLDAETPLPTTGPGTVEPAETSPPETAPTEAPTESGSEATQSTGGGAFQEGQTVVTSEEVRMRSEASTDSDVVEDMPGGTVLTILSSEPVTDSQYTWWNVRDDAKGLEGWVVETYLTAQ